MMTLALATAALLVTNPCTLVTRAEILTITGKPPTTVLPYGPENDPETKASVQWCVIASPVGLILYVDTFATPAAAVATMTRARILELMDSDVTVEPEPGLGDKAFWAHSDSSARMVVIRGNVAVSLVIGGIDLTKAGEKRAAARAMAIAALKRL